MLHPQSYSWFYCFQVHNVFCVSCASNVMRCVFSTGLSPLDYICAVCVGSLAKTCSCGVRVMLRSWMLWTEETEVLGKSSTPQAMQPTSGTATQLCTDSCRHPVWMNSWPGCLEEIGGWGVRDTKIEKQRRTGDKWTWEIKMCKWDRKGRGRRGRQRWQKVIDRVQYIQKLQRGASVWEMRDGGS